MNRVERLIMSDLISMEEERELAAAVEELNRQGLRVSRAERGEEGLAQCLNNLFEWRGTSQGHGYWKQIFDRLMSKERGSSSSRMIEDKMIWRKGVMR